MTRNEQLINTIRDLLGDADITWQELLQKIHTSHSDIKHVYGIRDHQADILSLSIKCNDRTLITCNFVREPIEPPQSWTLPVEL
jgi:hypothetical protein